MIASYVVLLRAVNVGGRNKMAMADLRTVLGAAGLDDVQTYIQSGNIICRSNLEADAVATAIKRAIAERFGHDIEVMVRNAAQWADIVAGFPYPDADPKSSGVMVLSERYDGDLDTTGFVPDECLVAGTEIYVNCPNRFSKTKLTGAWIEKQTGLTGTMRNWSTALKLASMLE